MAEAVKSPRADSIPVDTSPKHRYLAWKVTLAALLVLGLAAGAVGGVGLGLPDGSVAQLLSKHAIIALAAGGGTVALVAATGLVIVQHKQKKEGPPQQPPLRPPVDEQQRQLPAAAVDRRGMSPEVVELKYFKISTQGLRAGATPSDRVKHTLNLKTCRCFAFHNSPLTHKRVKSQNKIIGYIGLREQVNGEWKTKTAPVYEAAAKEGDSPRIHWDAQNEQHMFGTKRLTQKVERSWTIDPTVAAEAPFEVNKR